MNIIRQAAQLYRQERKGSTLRRRTAVFFSTLIVVVLLIFVLLLSFFGITGSGRTAVHHYTQSELTHLADMLENDMGNISVRGISLSESLSKIGDGFFAQNGITANELPENKELIEPLLSRMMDEVLDITDTSSCGGAFVLLDASAGTDSVDTAKAGIFLIKTQPVIHGSVKGRSYYLRGPAGVARQYGVELLGQWHMEYDISGQDFFTNVMETAREHPDLPLSRLYYWSECVTLKDDSSSGFLLCVPLRSADGTVFGVCGIEVSLRMFAQLYVPQNDTYKGALFLAAELDGDRLKTQAGLASGYVNEVNTLLGKELTYSGSNGDFVYYSAGSTGYGGLMESVSLYPSSSPYREETLCLALFFTQDVLDNAIRGNSTIFTLIVVSLLAGSVLASVFISRRYLKPVFNALSAIQNQSYKEKNSSAGFAEIDDLFAFLARKDKAHEDEVQRLDREKQDAQAQVERAQTEIERIAGDRKKEIDKDAYAIFLSGVKSLTRTQREIFDLYLDGKKAEEIMLLRNIQRNTIKYHNREIYSKLGVSSLKELLMYAALMKQERDGDE